MGSTVTVSCRGGGGSCAAVGVSKTKLYSPTYPPTCTQTHPPTLFSSHRGHTCSHPFSYYCPTSSDWPASWPSCNDKKPIVWVRRRWTGPSPFNAMFFFLSFYLFFFAGRVEEGAWKLGEDKGVDLVTFFFSGAV